MIFRLAALSILCLALHGIAPADAYNNGPILGTAQAYFVDKFWVTDSFQPNVSSITSLSFGAWTATGTTPATVDWALGTSQFGSEIGSGFANMGVNLTSVLLCHSGALFNGGICGAGLGYDVYAVTVSLKQGFTVTPGQTYWLTLTHAANQFDGDDGWDVNFGPSEAWLESKWDPIPSESFAINPVTVPEPGSITLFASTILGMLTALRRKRQ